MPTAAATPSTPPRVGLFVLTTETLELGRRLADLSFLGQRKPATQLSDACNRLLAIADGAEQLARRCRELVAQARGGL